MTDTAPQNFKVTDQGAESSVQKTPEAAKQDGVISGKPNQETFGQANTIKHQNDRTLSEPDMIAMEKNESVAAYNARVALMQANRFGFYDSAEESNGSAVEIGTVIDYQHKKIGEKFYAGGMAYEEDRDTRSIYEKLSDFGATAAARATDPEGQQAYIQGQLDKIVGIGEGLNIAKDGTKAAVVAGWTALTDGTVANFLAKPNAINDPLFHAVGGALDAMAKDPNAVNHALERVGTTIMNASERYTASPNREKGHVIGETMFAMVNPEGSTEAGEAALGVANKVATKVDTVVMDGIKKSLQVAEDISKTSPEMAQQAKQMLFEYTQKLGLSPQEMELAGIPKGYFGELQMPPGAGKGDNVFAMSKADDTAEGMHRRNEGGAEREPVREKFQPSEMFITELNQAVDNLEPRIKQYLQEKGVEIKPCRRVIDVFPDHQPTAMGCYSNKENCIYIAEEVQRGESWVKNFDVDFNLRHESGHAFSYTKKGFEQVSYGEKFSLAFAADSKNVPKDVLNSLGFDLSTLEGIEFAREEVFADSFAHATGCPTQNGYSRLIHEYFPNCQSYFGDK